MRILSFIGLGMGILAAGLAIYLHFIVVPDAESKEIAIEIHDAVMDDDDVSVYRALDEQRHRKIEYGEYTLLLGALAFLVSLFPAIKRNKFAILGGVLGLAAFFIGAAYGTHMFS
jgi:hypothetical protein